MAEKMKAQVLYEPNIMKFEEIDVPEISANEVLVKVKAVGICGSDISYYYGHSPLGTPDGKGPLVIGHEYSGEIAAVGDVPKSLGLFKGGERVTVNPVMQCNACPACLNGQYNVCSYSSVPGVTANGGFAQFSKVNYTHVYKIPDSISYVDAALTEPLACAAYAVKQLDVGLGQTVVVIGPGGIGLMMVQLAKSQGAGRTILVGRRDFPLRKGLAVGADHVINSADKSSPYYAENLAEKIKELSGGPAERCIVSTSTMDALQSALDITGNRSTIVYFGLPGPDDELRVNVLEAINKDRIIKFSWLAPGVWDTALKAVATGKVSLGDIITHKFSLADTEKGIRFMKESKEDKVKGVVIVDE
ncbi:MAG: alcohol dehydrogenase catalytic domain-containing protein [Oscillospiraceae bacterium]|nr:alcohol dehydrogenase catalytic domain-containing protein [Oscillospiraceae bacterium]